MRRFYSLVLVFSCLISGSLCAQTLITGKVQNDKTKQPVEFAVVAILDQDLWGVTNDKGEFTIRSVRPGKFVLTISCLGFEKKTIEYGGLSEISPNTILYLKEDNLSLNEVVVTAQKKQTEISTSYVINRNTINNLQATSVEDVLSLLPGSQTLHSSNLATSDAQRLALRSQGSGELDNASFGTAIEINGVRLSNNGNFTDGATSLVGVDTRNIGIHNIESIEVTTGLPSVAYGDLTSGLVSINTKKGKTPLEIELISKPLISSYSISKGFDLGKKGGILNASIDYTRSISDRTSPYTTYTRNNVTLEYSKQLGTKEHPIDFTYSFSGNAGGYNSEADPDEFVNTYTKMKDYALRNSVKANWLINTSWITNLEFSASMNYVNRQQDKKTTQSSSSTQAAVHATAEGYNQSVPYDVNPDASIISLPTGSWYVTQFNAEKPVSYAIEVKGRLSKAIGDVKNNVLLGAQYNSSGNYGRGIYYSDMRYAPTYREFRYDKQPFVHNIAFYAEEKATFPLFKREVQIQAGLRSEMTTIKGSIYGVVAGLSPRINAKYTLIHQKDGWITNLNVHAGWGDAVKLPSSYMLFPTPEYTDQLTFASPTQADNTNFYAYYTLPKTMITNSSLKWQRNRKLEFGIDLKSNIAKISLNGYIDRTLHPYRQSNNYTPYSYNYTDNKTSLVGCIIPETRRMFTVDPKTGIVTVSDASGQYASQTLAYTTYNLYNKSEYYTNGTPTVKKGIEWIVDFAEIQPLKTTIRFDGMYAYYKGVNETISSDWPSSAQIKNGNTSYYYKYIAYYVGGADGSNGSKSKKLTTNLTFTTHIPALRLIFSLRIEGCWYDYTQYLSESSDGSRSFVIADKSSYTPSSSSSNIYAGNQFVATYPLYYTSIDDMNTKIPFAEKFAWAKEHDQTLYNELALMVVKTNTNYYFNANKYSPYFSANINLTKEIGDNVSVSFQANNFFNNTLQVKSSWAGSRVSLYQNSKIPLFNYGLTLRLKL